MEDVAQKNKKGSNAPQDTPFTPKFSETGEVKTLMEWDASSRPFRKKDRSYYTTSATCLFIKFSHNQRSTGRL